MRLEEYYWIYLKNYPKGVINMSEIPAKQAREITNNKDNWNVELWFGKYKDHLFQQIQSACLLGHDHLLINS
jgi:hypothetical protein